MEQRLSAWLLALVGGVILTLMIDANSLLAKHSTPIFASFIAYGVGTLITFFLSLLAARFSTQTVPKSKLPLWIYLGGIPGAITVVLAALTVNSPLALAGSFALMLLSQIIFGIFSDHFGFFGTAQKKFTLRDVWVVTLILTGSLMIIYFR